MDTYLSDSLVFKHLWAYEPNCTVPALPVAAQFNVLEDLLTHDELQVRYYTTGKECRELVIALTYMRLWPGTPGAEYQALWQQLRRPPDQCEGFVFIRLGVVRTVFSLEQLVLSWNTPVSLLP
ncbi:hypothetical protein SAMN02745729_10347 [Marinobacterium iners DSM 11526]|uniref:Uncharacterized protein n=1 Tax=Marinobacterium iners DSM 11526 TaxID=1122198 RepID=A0A1H4ASV4_9GAMM|nr:hypothetical protein SAMN02745729_10347 [Marinobacterium iners DSM 11526]